MAYKILVVDDEPDLQHLVRQNFRRKIRSGEMEFLFAENGKSALNQIDEYPDIDMVLSDINMPEMDGLTLLGKIQEKNNLLKSVVVSAYGDMDNVRKAMNNGAFDFVTKPIDFDDLTATIEKTLKEVTQLKEALKSKEQLIAVRHELAIGQKIQSGFLPETTPKIDNYEIGVKYKPAKEVSGDFYDVFQLPNGNYAFVMSDICDKGVGAALFMALIRSLIRAYSTTKNIAVDNVDKIVNITHNYILDNHSKDSMFATLFIAELNPESGSLKYINAGHNPPIVLKGLKIKEKLMPSGPAVGIMPGIEYSSSETTIEPDDTLITFTDGVPEAANADGDLYTDERFQEFIQTDFGSIQNLVDNIESEISGFVEGAKQSDDISILAVKRIK